MNTTQRVLPSASHAFVLLVVLVVIVFGANYLVERKQKKEQEGQLYITAGETSVKISSLDTDNDGLEDWEELLWGTDKDAPDTDGDGTPDGIEVSSGRNPTIPAPGDTFVIKTLTPSVQISSSSSKNQTQTQLFSEAFITTYLNSKIVGGSFIEQVDTFTALAIPNIAPISAHNKNELKLSDAKNPAAAHAYGNAVGSVLKKNKPGTENELVVMLKALQNKDTEGLGSLNTTADAYDANARDLLLIVVPPEQADEHILLIHAFLLVARDIRYMAGFYEDPLTGLAGIESYFKTSEELLASISNLRAYLENTTSFTPLEDGYVITSNL